MENSATKNHIFNLIILDASGSMSSIYNQALMGVNKTITTIREAKRDMPELEQYLTLLSFASCKEGLDYVYHETTISDVRHITKKDYVLRGCTALYDAIGNSVTDLRKKMQSGDRALVTIITDGYENDSHHWNEAQVKALIEELRTQDWVFSYIGANQNVEVESAKVGIENSMRFEATVEGTIEMFEKENRARRHWNERVYRGEKEVSKDYFNERVWNNIPAERITPDFIDHLNNNEIFVFGSNMAGQHNGGAAFVALRYYGAEYGNGNGPQGQSYAIPTFCPKDIMINAINEFIRYAEIHPEQLFLVTKIGCRNAGYRPEEVAQYFRGARDVKNIALPLVFWNAIL